MPLVTRRTFLSALASAVPLTAIVSRAHAAAITDLAHDPATLVALGDAILPGELREGRRIAVASFQRWIDGYRAGAELEHGYGTSALTFAGPTPATRWMRQLDDLEAQARARHGQPFAALTIARRQALVRQALDAAHITSLGGTPGAQHVAQALLAHWYASSAAHDLCYQRQIGRQSCRPLAQQARKPLPLAGRDA